MEKQLILRTAGSLVLWFLPSLWMIVTQFQRGYLRAEKPVIWRLALVAIGLLSIYLCLENQYQMWTATPYQAK
jgi:type IV secretory pathway protease TraF